MLSLPSLSLSSSVGWLVGVFVSLIAYEKSSHLSSISIIENHLGTDEAQNGKCDPYLMRCVSSLMLNTFPGLAVPSSPPPPHPPLSLHFFTFAI